LPVNISEGIIDFLSRRPVLLGPANCLSRIDGPEDYGASVHPHFNVSGQPRPVICSLAFTIALGAPGMDAPPVAFWDGYTPGPAILFDLPEADDLTATDASEIVTPLLQGGCGQAIVAPIIVTHAIGPPASDSGI